MTPGDAVNTVAGKMQNLMGTSSRKNWVYFTPDMLPPDANSPPSDVLSMNVGQTLTASMSFVMPTNTYKGAANTMAAIPSSSTDFRFGVFYDPGDFVDTPNVTFPRLLQDSNNDSGNSGSSDTSTRWAYSQGYSTFIPIGTNVPGKQAGETQIGKRMNDTASTKLASTSGNFVLATTGGTAVSEVFDQMYTIQMQMHYVSTTQMDVTANVYQGSDTGTLVSTNTVSDLGTGDSNATFGGVAESGNVGVLNNTSVYNKFDQIFFRLNSSTDTGEIDITNFKVALTTPVSIVRGDLNFDGHVDAKDIAAMQAALTNTAGYLTTNFGNGTPASHGVTAANIGGYADVNGGTKFDNSDLQALLIYLKAGHGSAQPVPEPASFVLAGLGAVALGFVARRRKQVA